MMAISAQYTHAHDANGKSHICSATMDDGKHQNIDLRTPSWYSNIINQWIAAGNTPTPYTASPEPPVTCQLWQLQAVVTPEQWTAVQAFIASMADPTVAAFFAHGTNQISSDSITLAKIGTGVGLTADQITALMKQAAAVAIP